LEKKGYITRTRDAVDTRRQVLNITARGRDVHDQIMDGFAVAERKMLSDLSDDQKSDLLAILDKIARGVDRWKV
jgi:DNA-binding MarR family transcriptional regulator